MNGSSSEKKMRREKKKNQMTTIISLWDAYSGPKLPLGYLPFEYKIEIRKGEEKKFMDIYQTNIKVFERHLEKRNIMIEIFTKHGFKLENDCLVSVMKDGSCIKTYDRLIFCGSNK